MDATESNPLAQVNGTRPPTTAKTAPSVEPDVTTINQAIRDLIDAAGEPVIGEAWRLPVGEYDRRLAAHREWERSMTPEREQLIARAGKLRQCRDNWKDLEREVGPRLAGSKFSNYEIQHDAQRAVVARLQEYADKMVEEVQAGNGVVLFGPSGTGKDHLLVALGRRASLEHGFTVAWAYGPKLYSNLRDGIACDRLESDWLNALQSPSVLILSDPLPPRGGLSNHQAVMLQEAIDWRYRHLKPTWCSLNVRSSAEADELLAPAIVDRLRDGALCAFCNWPSYRKGRNN